MTVTVTGGTKIEWADFTFNPWWGCERVSPACAHCYADTFAKRVGQRDLWTKDGAHGFRWLSDANWAKPLRWAREAPEILDRRPRVFCASMADVFEERRELVEPRNRLFDLIEHTPELDWLLLTKRPDRIAALSPYGGSGDWPQNIWLGTSVENSRFTWRAHHIREFTQVAVRFISAEPLLGSLYDGPAPLPSFAETRQRLDLHGIDWVIIGGESGPGARPFHLDHAREIIAAANATHGHGRQAAPNGPAIFVKQLGAKPVEAVGHRPIPNGLEICAPSPIRLSDRKGGDMAEWPADLRIREFPRGAA